MSKCPVTKKWLLRHEWSMGNGQCPECCGMNPKVFRFYDPELLGHEAGCPLAKSISECGGNPIMVGEYQRETRYKFKHNAKYGCFAWTRVKK